MPTPLKGEKHMWLKPHLFGNDHTCVGFYKYVWQILDPKCYVLDLPIILQIRLYQTQSYVLLSVFQWILCHMCGNTHTGKTQKNYFNSEGIIQMFLIPLNNVLISKRKNNIFLFDF